jgi:multidrug efflux pump subunit AcrB
VFQFTMNTMGRLTDVEQFDKMIVKSDERGRLVRLGDVTTEIELGAQTYDQNCTLNGQPSVALSIYQLPGSNALETAKGVRTSMEEMKTRFPEGIDYAIVYDTTPFINQSIGEVFNTLRDAVILVAIVVLLFLQNWRSAIIPLVAVPVAIVGTFAVMAIMGFSLNNLTLFGLVLAIGIVVDDAIVVVEAVERNLERGLSPRDATLEAMRQVSGPVVAVGLVLSAVFIPCAFIAGITGQFFRQFALTIAVSTLLSAFNSLTLSPALTALLLRPRHHGDKEKGGGEESAAPPLPRLAFALAGGWLGWEFLTPWIERLSQPWLTEHWPQGFLLSPSHGLLAFAAIIGALAGWFIGRPLNWLLGTLFRGFNVGFNHATNVYTRMVGGLLRVSVIVLLVYAGLLGLTYAGFAKAPKGFIPAQDKGYLLVNVQLPDSASVQRTQDVMKRIEQLALETPGVKHTVAVAGQSLLLNANAPNFGSMYVMLDDFHARRSDELSGDAIAHRLQSTLQQEVRDSLINVFAAPPLEGLGTAGGFKIVVEDRGDNGLVALQKAADDIVASGAQTEQLQSLFTSFRANTPWLYLNIDRTQSKTMGVSLGELFNVLQVYLGSLYVNDFNRFGRTWQVNVQARADSRRQIEDLKQLKIRTDMGKMVPLATLATVEERSGPVLIMRYNMYPAAAVNITPWPGVSSGDAITRTQEVVREGLIRSMRYEWTELALLQLQTGNTAMWVFLLAVVLVFLVLAAQYESWSLPLAVILVVPMCLLCSVAGVLLAHLDVNIFTQVGFVVLVGLACKNAILIVEFAKSRREAGADRYQSTLEACKLRLRPIVMTSFAFILGVVPLVISEGAGAEMRRTLGTAVFAGMLGVTLFGVFLTPVFYYVIAWAGDQWAVYSTRRRPFPAANLHARPAPAAAHVG